MTAHIPPHHLANIMRDQQMLSATQKRLSGGETVRPIKVTHVLLAIMVSYFLLTAALVLLP